MVGERVEETKELTVHEFTMGDVEDPDLYAAEPLYKWQESAEGKWDAPSWEDWRRFCKPTRKRAYRWDFKNSAPFA
jgi:hypothetical protein